MRSTTAQVVTPLMSQNNTVRAFSDWFYYSIDSLIGYIMFILLGLLSFIGITGILQMKLLFNDTFSEQVHVCLCGCLLLGAA